MIASEKTERGELGQVGEDPVDHWADHSESGWTTVETLRHFLDILRSHYNDDKSSWPVLDCYSVHRPEHSKKHIDELGRSFVSIPAGMTDAHQSLDRYVFGVMKGVCRGMCRQRLCDDIPAKMMEHLAAQFLIRAWQIVSPHVLEQAWSVDFDEDET
jgi:hypothetical protein